MTLGGMPLAESASYPNEARAGDIVSYQWGRIAQFDDPRLLWGIVATFSALVIVFVVWQYRRERDAISRSAAVGLATLRLMAFAGAAVFFLSPEKRTDEQVVTQSRVAVLVDASQSMAVQDETAGGTTGVSRSEAVLGALRDSPLIKKLRAEHDVTVAAFDADVRRVAQWKRLDINADATAAEAHAPLAANSSGSQPAASDSQASPRPPSDWTAELAPIGAQTRMGDALTSPSGLGDASGAPLAGIFLFSDGGQNAGVDPLSFVDAAAANKTPIITVGVGSTAPRRNVRIQELIAPSRAYPDDKAVVRALVQAEGFRGRTVDVELYARQGEGAAAVQIDRQQVHFDDDPQAMEVAFQLEPKEVGRLELEARLVAPADDQYSGDNQRTAEVEVVETSSRILLVAGGATRDYRFLRNQLRRDKHATVDVLLQRAQPGISQDAHEILAEFPKTKQELFQYDCVVAFDPDWSQLDAQQADLLEQWVAQEAGGMIVVAGPVYTAAWIQNPELAKVRALYPVEFQRRLTLLGDGVFGSKVAWPLAFTREGEEADFLWLGDTPEASRADWARFPGVFGCYAVKGPKPGAQVYARYSDPEAGIAVDRPVYLAEQFYGAGRVFYMGSGEVWRLRLVDPGYFEVLYTKLIRHVSQGRLLRGSSLGRLSTERDRYYVGDTVVVRAQLNTPGHEPLATPRVAARVTGPRGTTPRSLDLKADASRPGNFLGQFTVPMEGSYRIELAVPDAPDEVLSKRVAAAVPDLEFDDTRRNETLLAALANRTGGHYYSSPEQAIEGTADQKSAGDLLPSRAETKIVRGKPDQGFSERVNRALLGVICGALCTEWLLRRFMKLA